MKLDSFSVLEVFPMKCKIIHNVDDVAGASAAAADDDEDDGPLCWLMNHVIKIKYSERAGWMGGNLKSAWNTVHK